MLHYSADQNGDAPLSVLLGLLVGGFLGLLMLKKFIPVYLNHYQVVGAMHWIEGELESGRRSKDEIPRLVQNALVSIG